MILKNTLKLIKAIKFMLIGGNIHLKGNFISQYTDLQGFLPQIIQ